MEPKREKIYCNDSKKNRILFETKAAANHFIKRCKRVKTKWDYSTMYAYHCKYCKGWHITDNQKHQPILLKMKKFFNSFFNIRQEKEIEKGDEAEKKRREEVREKRNCKRLDIAYKKINYHLFRLEVIMERVNQYSESLFILQNYLEEITETGITGKKLHEIHILLDELSAEIQFIGQMKKTNPDETKDVEEAET